MFGRINLAGPSLVGEPGPLPDLLRGGEANPAGLRDLSWVPASHGLAGVAFWPVFEESDAIDPEAQAYGEGVTYSLDPGRFVVVAKRTVRALTAGELTARATALAAQMEAARREAFETAMAFGNAVTAKVIGTYSDAEARTWPLQRMQADLVLAGGEDELAPDALLRQLAALRGIALVPMAMLVQGKAQAFETIAKAGQALRLGAEGLLSPTLDTPAKLEVARATLRAQFDAYAAQLGLPVPA